MSFLEYDSYQNSGVKWFGRVPSHWKIMPLKRCLERNDGGVWGKDPDGREGTIVLRSTEQTVDGRWIIKEPAHRKLDDGEIASALLEEGDLLLTKSSGSALHIGKTTIVDSEIANLRCCYSNFMQRLRTSSQLIPRIAWYLLNNELSRQQFDYLASSTTGLANLNAAVIGEVVIPVAPSVEQQAIAAFLDSETQKIDALVSEQRRLIELLKEKRQAVISHAVTKGLNLNAPFKPSGIQWLGDVPEHWDLTRVGFVATVARGTGYQNVEEVDENESAIRMIRISDFNEFCPIWVQNTDTLTPYLVGADDLLIAGTGASAGITMRVTEDMVGMIHSYNAPRIRCKSIVPDFLYFVLNSHCIKQQEDLLFTGSAQHFLDLDAISKLEFPVCGEEEQLEIVAYLRERLGRFDSLETEAERAIQLLQERRTALIAAAVTGKIDVRGIAESEAAA